MQALSLRFVVLLLSVFAQGLQLMDRFAIYEQMALHQTYIDNDQSCEKAHLYASLYWPEASFRVIDPNRDITVTGHQEIRGNFDSAHSVFPLYMWRHSVGAFEIQPQASSAEGHQRAKAFWK